MLAILCGGGIGSVLRYAVTVLLTQRVGAGYAWIPTLLINVTGSLIIGAVFELSQTRAFGISPLVRIFLMTGVLGGYTTFSTFSLDSVTLVADRAVPLALAYASGSVVLGFAAAYVGVVIARAVQP
ncbi:MAG: fluoride efflux transporter CrcB [bacterium]|nr:fluoride efflux transporter CrcB [bacterium]